MAFLRARQRVITALTPHQANRQFIIPSRRKLNPLQLAVTAAWDFTQGNLTDEVNGLTLDFARASQGSYFDASRVMQFAGDNVARFDHNPSDASALGLLIEEARTNSALESLDFSAGVWSLTGSSILTDTDIGPDNSMTMDRIVEDSTDGTHRVFQTVTTAAEPWTVSCYVKRIDRDWAYFRLDDGIGTLHAWFDLVNGLVGQVNAGLSNAQIERVGTELWRISVTIDVAIVGSNNAIIAMADANGLSGYQGDGSSAMGLWGFQFEAGAFPTSYIKTGVATGTREADVCNTFDMSWYDLTGGSWYVDVNLPVPTGKTGYTFTARAADNDNRLYVQTTTSGGNNLINFSSGTVNANLQAGSPSAKRRKIAGVWMIDDYQLAVNGQLSGVDQDGVLPIGIDQLQVGGNVTAQFFNGSIRTLAYIPERLPSSILQGITQ